MLYQMMDCPQEELLDDGALDGANAADVNGCDMDDDWGPENNDCWDSPTDFDEYEMNAEDCFEDPCDPYDMEYDQC